MKKILIVLCIFLLVGLSSCKKQQDKDICKDKMLAMKSYTATAQIKIWNNRGMSEYLTKQFYLAPDKLRIETITPDNLKGKVIVFNGKQCMIYNPLINQTYNTKTLNSETKVQQGIIDKELFNDKMSLLKETYHEKSCLVLDFTINEKNQYRNTGKLYIAAEENLPLCMELFDIKKKLVFQAEYSNFCYNERIDSNLFKVNERK